MAAVQSIDSNDDKSHLYGAGGANAYMAKNEVKDPLFEAKERHVDLSSVSAWCNPQATA